MKNCWIPAVGMDRSQELAVHVLKLLRLYAHDEAAGSHELHGSRRKDVQAAILRENMLVPLFEWAMLVHEVSVRQVQLQSEHIRGFFPIHASQMLCQRLDRVCDGI